ncbi:hypothetical protein [Erythrobacter sp.]|jgi:hypothetical protein|uniref:hypothetical protein n=1 Tax=Erythrobacter sp. TaxID=1042 RepID=UPI002ECADF73|nr:hypothetical protein [Erythrobacter sp.]
MQDMPPPEAPVEITVRAPSDSIADNPRVALRPPDDPVEQHAPMTEREDGSLVIDLTALAPPPPDECIEQELDPFDPEIIVCRQTAPSPRIGQDALPEIDDFGNAIPRARLRLSDTATLEANTISKGVGGVNANGGEVRLKIDF